MTSTKSGFFPLILALMMSALLIVAPYSAADVQDPLDPFDALSGDIEIDSNDENKSPEELLLEANILMAEERLLDARTKLLKVLQKNPKEYRAHMMLAGYYMQHVGHFRLALKYVLQAQNLFLEVNGKPPFGEHRQQTEHAQLLYLLSQARLNLDNYQGALEVLDQYTSYNYYSSWYPGTRAWILMKLNRVDEAIKVARFGVFTGAEPGRTLNMLGILLSMSGERENALQVFKQAITYELSLGTAGQPATPLNNSGEVYKEIFQEDMAEASWLKAIRLPDGCEHVLPSLNLALLYMEQLNFSGAARSMNNFEGCVAQYALRNGEEHTALVHLARGRVALHTGNIDTAISHLEAVLEQRQWFGKIGTSQDDLLAGATISLAQALRAKNNMLSFQPFPGVGQWVRIKARQLQNSTRAWWLMRRARQILIEDLQDMEDLYVRNTDSMIEYPTFGEVLADVPRRSLERRLSHETRADARKNAKIYYKAYLAENYMNNWRSSQALTLLNDVIDNCRPKYDDLLKTHALSLKATYYSLESNEYAEITRSIFALNRAKLRSRGLPLPVNYSKLSPEVISLLDGTSLYLDNRKKKFFAIEYEMIGDEHSLYFVSSADKVGNVRVKGANLRQVAEKFLDAIFTESA
ncbi:MAG: hypothetical protein J5J00_01275 [Deltaproteobacteria bacterium]|nr:hypothetical protein [Deltaproteobacteria bacterium]